ncbi:MAG: SusD/RagB family nutrient-binding outer membrane lipoprotein, partial [Mucilaginibacter sp.]
MKKYISFIAVVFAVGIAGCKKDYLSQEQNPNQPSITTPTLLLPAAEVKTAYIYQRAYPMYGVWDGYWTTSGNYVPNPSINEYQITTGDFGLADGYDIYTDLYLANANFNVLQGLSTGSENANYAAIAIIMKAFNFEQLVDNYNDVPYTQAFDPKNVTPAFDKGVDIYHDLGKQLDNAIKLIQDNPNATVPTTDVMFNGDMGQWAQFANTLKLRLAVMVYKKLGKTDPLVADLASTASVGYLSADAAINPGYT